jgi:UDP:flavonoid glycosyltransferase YjiC (YdhE family)
MQHPPLDKRQQVLEIGAGYTSAFLVQALHDNALELGVCAAMQARGFTVGDQKVPYFVDDVHEKLLLKAQSAKLHCVDNLAHQETTAHKLLQVSRVLGVEKYLEVSEQLVE